MDTKLDWGMLAPQPLAGRYPALSNGRVLFVVRNGKIDFPGEDTRVWSLSRIATVGWLNAAPTQFRVNVPGLVSSDGIACCAVVYFEVELKTELAWREKAATAQDSLYGSFVLIAKECTLSLFKKHEYIDLLLLKEELRRECASVIQEAVSSLTPYTPRKVVLDGVAAIEPGFDDALRRSHSADVSAEKTKNLIERQAAIEKSQRDAQRAAEVEDTEHNLSLKRKEDELSREMAATASREKLAREEAEVRQKLKLNSEQAAAESDQKMKEARARIDLTKSVPKDVTELQILAGILAADPKIGSDLLKEKIKNDGLQAQAHLEMVETVAKLAGAGIRDKVTATVQDRLMRQIGINRDQLEISPSDADEGADASGEDDKAGAGEASE